MVDMVDTGASHETDTEPARAAGLARLIPSVRFGLRAAVLAGVIATAGGAATNLGAPINAVAGPMDTTCCGTSGPVSRTV